MKWINMETLKQQDFQDYSPSDVMQAIDDCPAVDTEELVAKLCDIFNPENLKKIVEEERYQKVVHAHWIDVCNGKIRTCSACKVEQDATYHDIDAGWKYCPNCGAIMDEKTEE